MYSARHLLLVSCLGAALAAPGSAFAGWAERQVGRQAGGSVLVPSNQLLTPFGKQVELPLRPTGLTIGPDGRRAAFHAADTGTGRSLAVVDLAAQELSQAYDAVKSASFDGLAYSADGRRLYSSFAEAAVTVTEVSAGGELGTSEQIALPWDPGRLMTCCNPYPGGLAPSPDGRSLLVALSRENALGVVSLAEKAIKSRIDVGNAPHSVVVSANTAYVSNEGGRPARPGEYTNRSAGTDIVADPATGAASTGTVSVIDLAAGREVATIAVGLHPTALLLDDGLLYVANTSSDSVSVIDTRRREVIRTLSTRAFPGAPVGTMPNGLAMLPGRRLAVTLGRANAVALFDVRDPVRGVRPQGMLPTGWFPTGVAVDERRRRLVVANQWGAGSVADADAGRTSRQVGKANGTASLIAFPSRSLLRKGTRAVARNNGWDDTETDPPRGGVEPTAIPRRIGEPSLIRHVVYIVKENRTYDQVLGDIGRGESEPSLAIFGRKVTPNHHALAERFPLLDNFYVSGRRSNDGHQWAVQATNPDYLEKASGNDQRSDYRSFGSPPSSGFDALLYTESGFLWENALRHGKTFEDYGEYTIENQPPPARSDVPSLQPHVIPEYQGYNLETPDQERARIFRTRFAAHEAAGTFPDLTMMLLPNDHTGGSNPLYPTPESQMADNDAALGQIVEAISRSRFWKQTAIFVVEDDAQGGPDHVDGHRSPAFVISPYARRGVVDSTFYTQINVVRTIEQILGLPPMNPLDLAAVPMRSAFTDSADLSPYAALPPQVSTTTPNPPLERLSGLPRAWAKAISQENLTELDQANEELLNRDVWYRMTGWRRPYPGDGRVLHPDEVPAEGDAPFDYDG